MLGMIGNLVDRTHLHAWSRDHRFWWILGSAIVLINIITAINSVGFYHPDEHFQILEFLAVKLPPNPFGQQPYLAWEHQAQIRSWFQIFLYYCAVMPIHWLGWSEHWQLALMMRLTTAIMAMISTAVLARGVIKNRADAPRSYVIQLWVMLGFTFFVPYFNCRTSSESLGGIFAAAALGLYLWKIAPHDRAPIDQATAPIDTQNDANPISSLIASLLVGLLWGFSFNARNQIAFAILGFGLWHLRHCPKPWCKALYMSLGFFAACGIGVLTDYWGYGVWQFTPWKYFQSNILHGRAAEFGEYPWYDWFVIYYHRMRQPLAGTLFTLALGGILYRRRSLLAWSAGAFFIGHLAVAHKEDRFLFPLYLIILPLICDLLYDVVIPRLRTIGSSLPGKIGSFILVLNTAVLFYLATTPAELRLDAAVKLEYAAYRNPSAIAPLYFVDSHPLKAVNILPMHFFAPYDRIKATEIASIEDTNQALSGKERPFYVFLDSKGCQHLDAKFTALGCRLISRVPRVFSYFYWNGGFCKTFASYDRADLFVCDGPVPDKGESRSVAARP
jgi:phosphatidylinositol glycan class B